MGPAALHMAELLVEEINSFGQFCLLLNEEREALARMDQDALDELISRKQMLCEHLSRLAEQRQAVIGAGDHATVLRTLDPALSDEWNKLTRLAREARELNRINGTIIEVRLQHNQQALAVLKVGEAVATYSADGLSRSGGAARHLGSA